jgi:putative ABC transport system substrate-binding protein
MIDRRTFLMSSVAVLANTQTLGAQPTVTKRVTIGLLSPSRAIASAAAFVDEMRVLGYVEGRNLTMDYRWALAFERLPEAALSLSKSGVDAIVVVSTPAAIAAKAATKTTPIIMAASADPISTGVAESLARPGGNVTGLALMNPDLTAKRVEVLKEAFPNLSWLGAVHRGPSDHPIVVRWLKENEEAGRRLNVRVHDVGIAAEPEEWEHGLVGITKQPGVGVTILEDPEVLASSARMTDVLLKHRLPAVFPFRDHVETGGLLSYGVYFVDLFRRTAHYVDKIVRGAKPGDIPIEQPATLNLSINLKTAKALRLNIPRALVVRAHQVIE